jgi:hypothetical protein
MFRLQISEEITSIISTAWYFTTKSGGIWDFSPDALGGQWMDDALREGIVATIMAAPGEAAWYYGELTIQPHGADQSAS